MLLWFPTPYPDELLYSVFARYHVRSGNTSPKMTTEDLFGKRTIRAVWDLPAHLDSFSSQVVGNWEAEEIIRDHTMYPYYATFLLPEQAIEVKESMMGDRGSTIHTRIGAAASNVKPKTHLWTCSSCLEEDMDNYGEAYWHRLHQAQGVYVCPKHRIFLQETVVSVHALNQHEYVIASPHLMLIENNWSWVTEADFQILIRIAEMVEELFACYQTQAHDNDIQETYRTLLKIRGYASLNGYVRRKKLYNSFNASYSKNCLAFLQSSTDFKETNWLSMIFQKHRKSFHPLRHLLVMQFLGMEITSLFEKEDYSPFGKGPWPCLNVTCKDFHKSVVTSLSLSADYDSRTPVGTFTCHCGFVFSRKGPDKSEKDRYRIGTIKEYGEVWSQALRQCVQDGLKLTEIANRLQVDRATVKKYAALLNLEVPWKVPSLATKKPLMLEPYEQQLQQRQDAWLKLQEQHPHKSKTELRKLAPDVYAFLYRHENKWLNDHSPTKKHISVVNKRVDWEKRDEELLQQVQEVLESWNQGAEKKQRISKTAIGRRIGKLSLLQKKADKLPRTMAYIQGVSEDLPAFQMRRAEAVIEQLKRENERIIEWEVYRLAGLRSNVSNEVKRFITLKVTEYESVNY